MKLWKIFKQSVSYFNSLVKVNSDNKYSSKEISNIESRGYHEGKLDAYKAVRDYLDLAYLTDFNGKKILLPGDKFLTEDERIRIRKKYPLKRDKLKNV